MGASPSRETQNQYLDELCYRKKKLWRGDRRRKEVSLLPLTKKFMHFVQPDFATWRDSRALSNSGSGNSNVDASNCNTSRSSRRDYCPAQLCLDAAPASLPFVQQLYNAYREPGTQFYCRKESWGSVNDLPRDLYYPTIESFYEATVSCYEGDMYETNEDMQRAYDRQKLECQLRAFGSLQTCGAPIRRPKKFSEDPKIRPTPCAICFEYPTSSIAAPPREGADVFSSPRANRCGAPHGSVVLAPQCSFMVIGFVGLVPVRRQKTKASAESFLRPPAESAGDEGEGVCAGTQGEAAEYELVAFISKSAGEQHLGRALFQAAFLYVDQCRRAGLPGNPPLPSTRFSCFLMDVPSLCFLREVRLRCAELRWTRRLARALRRIRIAAHHLSIEMNKEVASELCAFMAECFLKLDFRPSPTPPTFLFAGFVGDAGSAVVGDANVAFPSAAIYSSPLPSSASEELRRLLKSRGDSENLLDLSGGGAADDGSWCAAKESTKDGTCVSGGPVSSTVKLVCVVGTNQLTVGKVVYPHATVLERAVEVSTGEFVDMDWTVAQDLSGQEMIATDFDAPDPDDARDYSVCVRLLAEPRPRLTAAASDVILSWSKNLYVQARVADVSNSHWVSSYPLDYYTAAMVEAPPPPPTEDLAARPTTRSPFSHVAPVASSTTRRSRDGKVRTSPLTASNVRALSRAFPCDSSGRCVGKGRDAADAGTTAFASPESLTREFYLWEFEHQGRVYTIGLVPNFARAIQRGRGNLVAQQASPIRDQSLYPERNGHTAPCASTCGDVIVSAVDPMSETDVSSAASQHKEISRSYSDRSSRSGETYRTAESSHSTISNLHLSGVRRTVRQRRMFLSLGTGQAYENGVPVSASISPWSGGGDSRAMSDAGRSVQNEAQANRNGCGSIGVTRRSIQDCYGAVAALRMSSGGNSTPDYIGRPHESSGAGGNHAGCGDDALLRSELQQARRYVNTPYEHSCQQFQPRPVLQRRLSGSVSLGLPAKSDVRLPLQSHSGLHPHGDSIAANGMTSLPRFGPGGYWDGVAGSVGYEQPGMSDISLPESSKATALTAGAELLQPPPKQQQLPPEQKGGGTAAFGSSRTLAGSGKVNTQPESVTGNPTEFSMRPQPPVLRMAAHLQEVKDADGKTKLRWDWRGPRKR
ncbi:hypothetical protein, conserved [Leishmania tarentolae]|uniref:Uncharacterized protein n=1 Tax=Leishmania tarentolae TaxID=5689 RepID=A0A640KPF6_LEITA|nr:hypothetical protein, conserved [Leishmania tarentolae]